MLAEPSSVPTNTSYCRCKKVQSFLQGLSNYKSEPLPSGHEALTCGSQHLGHVRPWQESVTRQKFSPHSCATFTRTQCGSSPLHLSRGVAVELGINGSGVLFCLVCFLYFHPNQHCWSLPRPMWLQDLEGTPGGKREIRCMSPGMIWLKAGKG